MGFKRLKVKAKTKQARGGGADASLEYLAQNWDDWKAHLASAGEDRDAVIEEFENACTDAGDAIQLDTAEEFSGESKAWGADDKANFVAVLEKYFVPDDDAE